MRFWHLAVIGAASLLPCVSAQAQNARTVYLYNSGLGTAPGAAAGARFAPLGNGTARVSRGGIDYEGASVLEIRTSNFAEGARFDLTQPLDIDPYIDKGFIRLRLHFQNVGGGGFGGGGGFPGGGGFGGGGFGGGGFRGAPLIRPSVATPATEAPTSAIPATALTPAWKSNAQFQPLPQFGGGQGFPGGGFPGGFPGGDPNMEGMAPTVTPQSTRLTELRLTLLRENGAMSGRFKINLNATQPDEGGWRLFTLPIKQMTMTRGASGPIKRALLTGDQEDTFYVAQAAIGIETGVMTVSLRRPTDEAGTQNAEIEVKPGPVSLIADVEAGSADAEVTWNFDADNNGNLPPTQLPGTNPGGFPGGGFPGMDPAMGGMGQEGMPGPVAVAGPRVDARGLTATFTYPNEEQNYRVEVTVRDKNGTKKPVTASIIVKVRG